MEPEESDPGQLVGWHVVEVGKRQAHPYLTFADPESGREVRIYVDAKIRVSPDTEPLRQDDDRVLVTLDRLTTLTVESVQVGGDGLELTLENHTLWIHSEDNEVSTHAPWWVGIQSPGTAPPAPGTGSVAGGARQLLTAGHVPLGFTYPAEFLRIVEHGLLDLEPWNILTGVRLAQKLIGLRKRYPGTPLVPFASRIDNDDLACWDLDLTRGQVVIIQDWASPGWERRREFDSTVSWFRQAVEDCIELCELGG